MSWHRILGAFSPRFVSKNACKTQFLIIMIGTITNTLCIIVGSVAGSMMRRGIKDKYREVLFDTMGLASIALGCSAFVQNMPKSEYPVLFIISIALGCLFVSIYLVTRLSASAEVMQGPLLNELCIVGGLLIMSSGLSILKIKDCKTLNFIPALFIPIIFYIVKCIIL